MELDKEQLEAELKRNRALASLAMLTGDRTLAPFGALMLKQEHERGGADSKWRSVGKGWQMNDVTGEMRRDPGYAEYEAERDELEMEQRARLQADMLDRLGYAESARRTRPQRSLQETEGGFAPVQFNEQAPGGVGVGPTIPVRQPIPAEVRQKAAEANRLAQEATDIYKELEKIRGTISSPKDIITDLIGNVPVVGPPISRVMREGIFSPAQLSLQTRGARFEQNLSNLAAGLALTGYEIKQRDRWSPFAVGISQEESKRRLKNVQRDFAGRADTMLEANRPQSETVGTDEVNFEDLP